MKQNQYLLIIACLFLVVAGTATPEREMRRKAISSEQFDIDETAAKEKLESLSEKEREKLEHKLKKVERKLDRKQQQASEDANRGVRAGIVLLAIGLILAIVGFAALGNLIGTIGLVVLIVGLVLWLLDAI